MVVAGGYRMSPSSVVSPEISEEIADSVVYVFRHTSDLLSF